MADRSGISEEALSRLRDEFLLTDESIEAMPDASLQRALLKLEHPDRPTRRLAHYRLSLQDDRGEIRLDAHEAARQQPATLAPPEPVRVAQVPTGPTVIDRALVPMAPSPGLSPANVGWSALGPGNIGGRIRSIVIDPSDGQTMFAGAVGGGVWITTDGGSHWRPTNDLMGNLAVCSLVMDPTDSAVMYAGTGEGFGNMDAIRGAGIFTTPDGGKSWNQLKSTSKNRDFHYVNRLAISTDGTTLLAATSTGIFRSADRGATWSRQLAGNFGRVEYAAGSDSKVIAGGNNGDGRIAVSSNGGDDWQISARPTPGAGRVDVTFARQDSSTVYASANLFPSPSEIWRSTDSGATFAKMAGLGPDNRPANALGRQGWYDNVIWAGDPTNKDFLVVGGVDLFRSTDAGDSLRPISTWWSDDSAHADQHTIVPSAGYDGAGNKSVYIGNDGGVYLAADISTVGNNAQPPYTNGWTDLNNELEITQFYAGVANPTTTTVIGGTQDNGTIRHTEAAGANAWNAVFGGDGGSVASDPTDSTIYYGEYVHLEIFRNADGGASKGGSDYISGRFWNQATRAWDWKPAPFMIPDAKDSTALFIAPFVLDPNHPHTILGGGQSLWRTTDAQAPNTDVSGPRWQAIKPPTAAPISAIAIAPTDSDHVLVGHSNGEIYRSTDATAQAPSWTRIDQPIGATRMCTCVAFDPTDDTTIYATFGGYQTNNVWKTTDSGASWDQLGPGMPDAPARWITVHPSDSDYVYLATEVGLFVSDDAGVHWSPTNEGPANVCVYQLFWMNETLLCATHGRGIFQIDVSRPTQATALVVGDSAGELNTVDAATGGQGATAHARGPVTAAALVDGQDVFVAGGSAVERRQIGDLSPLWTADLDAGQIDASPVLDRGTLYVATAGGWLVALDPQDGTEKWRLDALQLPAHETAKVVDLQAMNRWLYLAGDHGVQAIDIHGRSVEWSAAGRTREAMLVAANRVFVPGEDGALQALDARSGAKIWRFESGAQIATAPAWILGGVCFGDINGDIVIADFQTGHPLIIKPQAGETIEAVTAHEQTLFVVSSRDNGTLTAWSIGVQETGWSAVRAWTQTLPSGVSRSPVINDETLYATGNDGVVVAVDISTAPNQRQLWQYAQQHPAIATPAVVVP